MLAFFSSMDSPSAYFVDNVKYMLIFDNIKTDDIQMETHKKKLLCVNKMKQVEKKYGNFFVVVVCIVTFFVHKTHTHTHSKTC